MSNLFLTTYQFGLLYSILGLGVFITFRVLNFPDLSLESSFVLGSVVSIIANQYKLPIFFYFILSIISGVLVAVFTCTLHTKVKMNKILSGILSLSIFYTITLRVMGTPNISISRYNKSLIWKILNTNNLCGIFIMLAFVLLIITVIIWFMGTKYGYFIRACGVNENAVCVFGTSLSKVKFIGLMLGHSLVSISGLFISQFQGFADINMGNGIIIIGMASLLIGETLFFKLSFSFRIIGVILGSFIYQFIINSCLIIGFTGSDLKLITAIIIIILILIKMKGKNNFDENSSFRNQ